MKLLAVTSLFCKHFQPLVVLHTEHCRWTLDPKLDNLLDRMGPEWCLHQASKCNFGVLWPWPLTPKVGRFVLALWTTCANLQPNCFIRFQNIMFTTLITRRHSVERMYLRQRPKSENWASLTPRSSATVRRTEKSNQPGKLIGLWSTTWSKQYLYAVHPVTCSLLWVPVWPTSTDLQLSDFPVPASGLWSGSGSKVDQFVHVVTPVDTPNFIQIHARVFE